MVRKKILHERLFLTNQTKRNRANAIKQLASKYSLPEYLGELFLNEIKLGNGTPDQKQTAKILGLI